MRSLLFARAQDTERSCRPVCGALCSRFLLIPAIHGILLPAQRGVLEPPEPPPGYASVELEIVVASVLSVVKSCWGKGCLVVKVAVEIFEEVAEEVRL